jgi:flavin reductase (DIM6/NTAB) family NADH-FMN oxidoreductase RutF
MSVLPEQLRAALGRWPSGVSVVTSFGPDPVGMTVSAFFGISLEPPLVGVSLARKAATLAVIERTRCFAINVLADDQALLSDRFAYQDEALRFEGVALHPEPLARSPLLGGAVLQLDCALDAAHMAGDHVLCVGQVRLARIHGGEPLLIHAAGYHRLTPLVRPLP